MQRLTHSLVNLTSGDLNCPHCLTRIPSQKKHECVELIDRSMREEATVMQTDINIPHGRA